MPQPQIDESSLQNVGDSLEETVGESEAEETVEEVSETTEPVVEKIKVGEKEYTTDELSELVGLGARAKDIGESHGGFDKFVSEYGRKSERIGELKKQLEEREAKATTETTTDDEGLESAREAARKLGIVLKDDLDSYYQNRRGAEKLLESCQTLEGEVNGTDGRPKFETTKVLEFMNQNPGFTDPMKAYEAMNLDEISSWKAEQISKKKTTGITTVTETNPNKQPQSVKITKDNLYDLVSEQMRI